MNLPSTVTPYSIQSTCFFIQDAPRKNMYDLDFHLNSDDYLGFVASALGPIIDDYAHKNDSHSIKKELLLRKIQKDLARLHETHHIVPRSVRP